MIQKTQTPQLNMSVVRVGEIDRLKNIKKASVVDFTGGQGLFWLMKKILIEQEERINDLEFKIAKLCGEVEPE